MNNHIRYIIVCTSVLSIICVLLLQTPFLDAVYSSNTIAHVHSASISVHTINASHYDFSESYRLNNDKLYTDTLAPGNINFYYINSITKNSSKKCIIKIHSSDIKRLSAQLFTENNTLITYKTSYASKQLTITPDFTSFSLSRCYIALSSNCTSTIKLKLRQSIHSFATPKPAPTPKPSATKFSTPQKDTKPSKASKPVKANKPVKSSIPSKNTKAPTSHKTIASTHSSPSRKHKHNTSIIKIRKLTLSKHFIVLKLHYSYLLKADIYPVKATTRKLGWSSSNQNIVSVSSGRVTAHRRGIAIVRVHSTDGSKRSATCTIKVS